MIESTRFITHHAGNYEIVFSVSKTPSFFRVLLSGDPHLDSAQAKLDMFESHLKEAREGCHGFMEPGDLFDAMQGPKDPRSSFWNRKKEHAVDDYFSSVIRDMADYLEPLVKPLPFVLLNKGNHEQSPLKHHGIDLIGDLVAVLRSRGCSNVHAGTYGGYVLFSFRKNGAAHATKLMKYHHGKHGGEVTHGVIGSSRRAVYYPDADIIWTGHIHKDWEVKIARERYNRHRRIIGQDYVLHISTSTYKDEWQDGTKSSYSVMRHSPGHVGAKWLEFEMRKNHDDYFCKARAVDVF